LSSADFDPDRALIENADHLNSISCPDSSPQVEYEYLSGALIWSDETNRKTPTEAIWALRLIFAYRTNLILDKPRDEFKRWWDLGLSLFPQWVGFRTDRRQPIASVTSYLPSWTATNVYGLETVIRRK
jgi:hypothetical protein